MIKNLQLYWDTSAVIALFKEETYSKKALEIFERSRENIISTLGFSEILAVLSKINIKEDLSARDEFIQDTNQGVWNKTLLQPSFQTLELFSSRYPLKGADLWHLSVFSEIKKEFPTIQLLTFDQQLRGAAQKEGFLYS